MLFAGASLEGGASLKRSWEVSEKSSIVRESQGRMEEKKSRFRSALEIGRLLFVKLWGPVKSEQVFLPRFEKTRIRAMVPKEFGLESCGSKISQNTKSQSDLAGLFLCRFIYWKGYMNLYDRCKQSKA